MSIRTRIGTWPRNTATASDVHPTTSLFWRHQLHACWDSAGAGTLSYVNVGTTITLTDPNRGTTS